MRKLLLFVPLFLALSCYKEENPLTSQQCDDVHHVTIDAALAQLDAFLSEYDAATKTSGPSRHYTQKSVVEVKASNLSGQTKSLLDEDRDLVYIVNFDDDKGAAVLSADDRTGDIVLAVMEKGSLSVNDFAVADEMMHSSASAEADDQDDFLLDMGESTVPALLLSNVMSCIAVDASPELSSTKALSSEQKYGPYTVTKWCQSQVNGINVFNRFTPNNDPAGCVVIAVAQILVNTKNITYTGMGGTVCYRDSLLTVAHYQTPNDPGTDNAQIQAAAFAHELGCSSLFCNVTYHHDGTTGYASGAKRTLEAFLYTNVTKTLSFNSSNRATADHQLQVDHHPVYLGGCHSGSVYGHAWLLDGVWGSYYHINWGWNGAYDGYFTKGTFDPQSLLPYDSEHRDSVDEHCSGRYSSDTIEPYTWTYRMVTYSL